MNKVTNTSIFNAFERMWQHTVAKLETKADTEYIDILKSKIDNHTHSWNELTDKPFYNEQAVIDWDGNTDGKDAFTLVLSDNACYSYYKLSDNVPTINDLIGGTVTFNGEVLALINDSLVPDVGCYYLGEPAFVVVQNTNASMYGIAITPPSTGIYFMNMEGAYVSNLTYGYTKTLDEVFIPDTIARKSDISGTNAVRYDTAQELSEAQKATARDNIDAITSTDIENALTQRLNNYRGNWEQNDSTAENYIKNRTHYTENELVTLIEERMDCSFDGVPFSNNLDIQIGQNYTVIFDETTYECVGFNNKGYKAIGAPFGDYFIGDYSDYPFSIFVDNGGLHIDAQVKSWHNVKIMSVNETVHKLDEKYIPDTIARISDISEVYVQNEKPVDAPDGSIWIDLGVDGAESPSEENVPNIHVVDAKTTDITTVDFSQYSVGDIVLVTIS